MLGSLALQSVANGVCGSGPAANRFRKTATPQRACRLSLARLPSGSLAPCLLRREQCELHSLWCLDPGIAITPWGHDWWCDLDAADRDKALGYILAV